MGSSAARERIHRWRMGVKKKKQPAGKSLPHGALGAVQSQRHQAAPGSCPCTTGASPASGCPRPLCPLFWRGTAEMEPTPWLVSRHTRVMHGTRSVVTQRLSVQPQSTNGRGYLGHLHSRSCRSLTGRGNPAQSRPRRAQTSQHFCISAFLLTLWGQAAWGPQPLHETPAALVFPTQALTRPRAELPPTLWGRRKQPSTH